MMVESKTPDMRIMEFPFPENQNNLFIESFVFQHPKNRLRSKDVSIEDIFSFDELYDFQMIS